MNCGEKSEAERAPVKPRSPLEGPYYSKGLASEWVAQAVQLWGLGKWERCSRGGDYAAIGGAPIYLWVLEGGRWLYGCWREGPRQWLSSRLSCFPGVGIFAGWISCLTG